MRIYRGRKAVAVSIQMECGKCGAFVTVESGYSRARCKGCGSVSTVPKRAETIRTPDAEVYDED